MKPFNNYKSLKKVYAIFIVVLLLNYTSLIYFCVSNKKVEHFDTDLNKIYCAQDSDGDGMPDDWEIYYGLDESDSSDKFEDPDEDTVLNYYEYLNGTKPNDRDSDKDGMWDGWEIYYGLNPINKSDNMNDNDDDGLKNFEEFFYETNPNNNDTDLDGLLDGDEIKIYGTLPNSADSDGDGMEDGWEINYKLDPLNNTDATLDMDNDGTINLDEFLLGTFPNSTDSDSDGLNDTYEIEISHTNPLKIDTDDDGLPDAWEILYGFDPTGIDESSMDPDQDGLINLYEFGNNTNPLINDTDGDGYLDGEEIIVLNSDPNNPYYPRDYNLNLIIIIIIELSLISVLVFLVYIGIKSSKKDIDIFQVLKNFFQKLKKNNKRKIKELKSQESEAKTKMKEINKE